jgi:Cys-rich protein (TIGR01571 family)
VIEGQTLTVPLSETHLFEKRGKWKDGLFSCFRFGLFHPHVWVAWICPQLLMGQILQRMNMSWLADPSITKSPIQSLMRKILILLLMLSVYDALMAPPLVEVTINKQGDVVLHQTVQHRGHQMFCMLMSLPMTVYGFWIVVKLRAAIRARYGIPTGKLGRLEDCCYVFCCNCCVMSQLARQTADYEDEPADCCSTNGLKPPSYLSDHDKALTTAITD